LYARWVQLGVFSPIMRLHSTNNPFHDRRPWGNGADAFRVAVDAMQLRHALIPYLYSMAWRMTQESIPLVTPLYYRDGDRDEAYRCRNQFYFGSELMAAPFVTPRDPETNLSRHTVWLPPGDWFDFTTGEHFAGDRTVTLYGGLDDVPAFARAGAIVPLGPRAGWGGVENPAELTVHLFPGADGAFTLYEDDGVSTAYLRGDYALTRFSQRWGDSELHFRIAPVEGEAKHVPAGRQYRLLVRGVRRPDTIRLARDGEDVPAEASYDEATESLALPAVPVGPADELTLTIGVAEGSLLSKRDRRQEKLHAMLRAFKLESRVKHELYRALPELLADPRRLSRCAGDLDRVSDAQWMALRNVLERT
jgi:hypothetical protein